VERDDDGPISTYKLIRSTAPSTGGRMLSYQPTR